MNIANKATLSEKEKATELLADLVSHRSDEKAMQILDEAFALIERIKARPAKKGR